MFLVMFILVEHLETESTMLLWFNHRVLSKSMTPWTVACQASLSLTISQSLFKFRSITFVMPFRHIILWHPLLLSSIFSSIRGFSNESAVHIRWKNTWVSASASVLPMNIQGWFPLRLTGLNSLLSKGLSGVISSTIVRRHQFFGALPSLQSSSHNHVWPLGRP